MLARLITGERFKHLLPFGCLSPLPCSDEMSDKRQGRLGVFACQKGL